MLLINIREKVIILLLGLIFVGCSILPPMPYKIDIQQGNVVTQDMIDQLKPGMTKSQVRFVMGTPLIVDMFRDNRWDYLYYLQEEGELIDKRGITIFFEDDGLSYIEGEFALDSPDGADELFSSIPLILKQGTTESTDYNDSDKI
jgi:outer membrane protein assembly factor BamE